MSPAPTQVAAGNKEVISGLLRRFRLEEVLNEDTNSKTIWLLGAIAGPDKLANAGSIPGETAAVVTLERLAFSSQDIRSTDPMLLSSAVLNSGEHNDIYSWATGTLHSSIFKPDTRVAIIYPATQKHIDKYRRQQCKWVSETPEKYATITRPFIDAQPASRLQWVYNILSKQVESERIVFEDADPENGFIILPDLKWDATNPDNMYLVAIVHRRDIKSLRDLTAKHLPLLKNIRDNSIVAAQAYGVSAEQLRLYIHYQPSYYHFHVHITNVNFEGKGMLAGRAHLLDTVVDNIECIAPDYYQRASIPFTLGSGDILWKHWHAQSQSLPLSE
ncbi:HIT-like domain-containing protein [Kickxella alabastrina]|uniref:HIT-like domain-containing protein n=1 Tax=Kickxella alabastrina TaxID=61397 RepID=UPI0022201E79|nr:HIT-like domain-containing protein [Kickxella alabastrina]KAI7833058.1 HIT-like domain-containing protein [Kickxella alabastrina]